MGRSIHELPATAGGAQTGGGMAKAGVILGIIAIAWSVVSGILLATGALEFGTFNASP